MRHGFLLIDKPEGPTSHDIVAQVRRALGERKVGHLGTLDPAASGLMVLAVGAKALKTIELFPELPKEYEARVTFGVESSTYDRDGVLEDVVRKPGVPEPDIHVVHETIRNHVLGKIRQIPPAHSAVHIDGERAYAKARRGEAVQVPEREVEISACEILSFTYPELTLRIACSSGTYIRSIAHDLGRLLRCGGYLSGLRRTKVGDWSVEDAHTTEDAAWGQVIPMKDLLTHLPAVELNAAEAEDIRFGRSIQREVQADSIAWHNGLPIAVLIPLKDGTRQARARKVF